MVATEYKNIILAGPSGSLGAPLLQGLLSSLQFTVSALVRSSSTAIPYLRTLPNLYLITISDSYPYSDLVAAFQGQDVVVSALTTLVASDQVRFIDAAIEGGVKRFVASEYGLNNANPKAQGLNSVFGGKGKVQEYLRKKEREGLTWSSITCGMWISWSMQHKFLGLRPAEKHMIFWDDGKGLFSATTLDNTVRAVINSLLLPSERTANRSLFIQDFATSQAELLAAIEKISGEKWSVETVDSEAIIHDANKRLAEGDKSATWVLIETGFVTGRYGGNLAEEGPIENELLDLQPVSLEDVVREGLETFKRTGYT
ncbi:MAG: hypothetical protein M1821_001992 [Bathelium mastoideum]|nr:MAG: hypothetical protein M1821_001992 [Bathelium mastoideum]KAI9692500.1 MAG: hypothetical protein M1822_006731 [Bathelium mastoideum]